MLVYKILEVQGGGGGAAPRAAGSSIGMQTSGSGVDHTSRSLVSCRTR